MFFGWVGWVGEVVYRPPRKTMVLMFWLKSAGIMIKLLKQNLTKKFTKFFVEFVWAGSGGQRSTDPMERSNRNNRNLNSNCRFRFLAKKYE